jgi:hypothetical protein
MFIYLIDLKSRKKAPRKLCGLKFWDKGNRAGKTICRNCGKKRRESVKFSPFFYI